MQLILSTWKSAILKVVLIGTHIFDYIHKDDQEEMLKILNFTQSNEKYFNLNQNDSMASISSSSLSDFSTNSNEGSVLY